MSLHYKGYSAVQIHIGRLYQYYWYIGELYTIYIFSVNNHGKHDIL